MYSYFADMMSMFHAGDHGGRLFDNAADIIRLGSKMPLASRERILGRVKLLRYVICNLQCITKANKTLSEVNKRVFLKNDYCVAFISNTDTVARKLIKQWTLKCYNLCEIDVISGKCTLHHA